MSLEKRDQKKKEKKKDPKCRLSETQQYNRSSRTKSTRPLDGAVSRCFPTSTVLPFIACSHGIEKCERKC